MNINQVNKAIMYEKITDYANFNNRTLQEEISDITSLNPDMIFKGFWQWGLNVISCNDITDPTFKDMCIKDGTSYESLFNSITQLKQSLPNTLIIGGVPTQVIQRQLVYNPKTGLITSFPDTWNMALDPSKWGITSKTKEQLQCAYAQSEQWYPPTADCALYDYTTVTHYFPDLTNPQFQEILLSWAYTQIDAGVDGIWIDMLLVQAGMLYELVQDMNHPSIIDTENAIGYIIDSIHNYGTSVGRQIYVGTWTNIIGADRIYPLDFLATSPTPAEVSTMTYNAAEWDSSEAALRNKYPTIKIIGFLDWASTINTPLGQFSQVLTHQQQLDFIRLTDNFLKARNMTFAYPVHGGWMGIESTRLSFGTRYEYDSKAPEFQSYDTIKQLMTGTSAPPSNKLIIGAGVLVLVTLIYLAS